MSMRIDLKSSPDGCVEVDHEGANA